MDYLKFETYEVIVYIMTPEIFSAPELLIPLSAVMLISSVRGKVKTGASTQTRNLKPNWLVLDVLLHSVITLEFNHMLGDALILCFVNVTLVHKIEVVNEAADFPCIVIFSFRIHVIIEVQVF